MCTELWGHHRNQYLNAKLPKTRLKHYRGKKQFVGIEEDQIIKEHEYDYIQILKRHYFSKDGINLRWD